MSDYISIVKEWSGTGAGPIGHTDAKAYLRHTHPVLGVDRIIDHDFKAGWVHAVRAISCSQPAFGGHFPDYAVYPGTHLCQDTVQVAILLFIGMTGPLNKRGDKYEEITVVNAITASFGHPVPPGSLLDLAVWSENLQGRQSIQVGFEARMRDFCHYETPTSLGVKFGPSLQGTAQLVRVRRRIYDGIGC